MPAVVTRGDDDDGNGSSRECKYKNIGHLFRCIVKLTENPH